MSEIVNRDDIKDDWLIELLKTETHHDHEIIMVGGSYRWKEDKLTAILTDYIGLNELINQFIFKENFNKNSEIWRELYRKIGYSLYGYWEVFYWEMNNEECENYKQPFQKEATK